MMMFLGSKCLGEDVSKLFTCGDVFDPNLVVLDRLTDEVVPDIDVFCSLVVRWIFRDGNGSLIVRIDDRSWNGDIEVPK